MAKSKHCRKKNKPKVGYVRVMPNGSFEEYAEGFLLYRSRTQAKKGLFRLDVREVVRVKITRI